MKWISYFIIITWCFDFFKKNSYSPPPSRTLVPHASYTPKNFPNIPTFKFPTQPIFSCLNSLSYNFVPKFFARNFFRFNVWVINSRLVIFSFSQFACAPRSQNFFALLKIYVRRSLPRFLHLMFVFFCLIPSRLLSLALFLLLLIKIFFSISNLFHRLPQFSVCGLLMQSIKFVTYFNASRF